jgi:hypothetical protein
LAAPIDVQAKLDDWLEGNEAAQRYILKLWYVPHGTPMPPGVTHVIGLASVKAPERQLVVGAVLKPEAAIGLDMILALLATLPN